MSDGSITAQSRPRRLVYRHALVTRITHWVNVLCIVVLLLSGMQIFNAHPALYIGSASDFDNPVLSITAATNAEGERVGLTRILGATFTTTGVLGLSTTGGSVEARAFPSWLTVPSYRDLATGRRWHFFFAWIFVINGLVYLVASLINRHITRDLIPTGRQLRGIGRSILDHARFRFHHERDYNVLQKLTYLAIIFLVLPGVILTGMTMSPALDAAFPWLLDLFGGRQTARTIHFVCATAIVLFILVHLLMVLVSGAWNNTRSIVTGRYAVDAKEPSDD
ncbi:cytochrome b/b6 domain-containing protein [Bauldia litoralis]|uniref:cytochrome b/b6 domain-containing protein n=1 Tax=Bauldia litoralis TaxID=665467 RepID=UPI00326659E2